MNSFLKKPILSWISFKEVEGGRSATYQGTTCVVQHWYCWVDGTYLQLLVFEGHSKVLAVNCKWKRSFVHIQKDSEHALSFKNSSVAGTLGVWVMSQLAHSKESPPEVVVAKCCSLVTLLWFTDTDFKFMFSSCVGHNLPVVDSLCETDISEKCAEEVVLLFQENPPVVLTYVYYWQGKGILQVYFPYKARDQYTHDFPLQSQLFHPLLKFLLAEVRTKERK